MKHQTSVKIIDSIFAVPKTKPRTVCICGSTKFKDDMMVVAREMTLRNHIVVMPLVFAHQGDAITEKQKTELDGLHKWKIKSSSLVVVVCRDLYIGRSTIDEITYANMRGITVQIYNDGEFVFGFGKPSKFSDYIHLFSEKSQEIYNEWDLSSRDLDSSCGE
jgi:hypothetical protein